MSILLGLLGLGLLAGSAVKCSAENAECMSKPQFKHECGKDVYYDRLGNAYIDGRRVQLCGNYIMDAKTGKTIWRRDEMIRARQSNEARTSGKMAYMGHHFRFKLVEVLIETSTGKVIAMLQRKKMPDGTYECRKWYAYDHCADMFGGSEAARSCTPTDSNWVLEDDPGIIISEREFEGLNVYENSIAYVSKDDKTKCYSVQDVRKTKRAQRRY